MFKPFWYKVSDFIKQRTIIKTESYSRMKINQIKKRRTANKLARKQRKFTMMGPGRNKRLL